jgi:SNF family Na+-dependent transporter
VAFAFFGPQEISSIAASGSFNLGFVTMPLIFEKIPLGAIFAFLWFILLFLAGITSSVSLAQPAIAFLEDEFDYSRKKASWLFGIIAFVLCQPAIFGLAHGVVDELDFWGGTFCLVLFGTVETILFAWIFGMEKAWDEIHQGADLRIPVYYKWIIKYITPTFLLAILGFWLYQDGLPTMLMKNVSPANKPIVLAVRLMLVAIFLGLALAVRHVWKTRRQAKEA